MIGQNGSAGAAAQRGAPPRRPATGVQRITGSGRGRGRPRGPPAGPLRTAAHLGRPAARRAGLVGLWALGSAREVCMRLVGRGAKLSSTQGLFARLATAYWARSGTTLALPQDPGPPCPGSVACQAAANCLCSGLVTRRAVGRQQVCVGVCPASASPTARAPVDASASGSQGLALLLAAAAAAAAAPARCLPRWRAPGPPLGPAPIAGTPCGVLQGGAGRPQGPPFEIDAGPAVNQGPTRWPKAAPRARRRTFGWFVLPQVPSVTPAPCRLSPPPAPASWPRPR